MTVHEGRNPVLISVEELRHELDLGEKPAVFDVRWKLGSTAEAGRAAYMGGHIPGAVFVDLEHRLSDPNGGEGRHPLPCPDAFEHTARRLGICNDCPVVIYDDGLGLSAARMWWLLTDAGHEDVRILDGRLSAWMEAGYDIETGEVRPREGRFIAETGQLDVVDADEVESTDATVWDVRAPERFRGESDPVDHVAGHIPGSRNLPAATLFVDGALRPIPELEEILAEVKSGDIISCGSGITACQVIWALHVIGKTDVSLYAGSWSDWISDPDRAVEVSVPADA